jgi:hypothetical protein
MLSASKLSSVWEIYALRHYPQWFTPSKQIKNYAYAIRPPFFTSIASLEEALHALRGSDANRFCEWNPDVRRIMAACSPDFVLRKCICDYVELWHTVAADDSIFSEEPHQPRS